MVPACRTLLWRLRNQPWLRRLGLAQEQVPPSVSERLE